jgi:hypothetical protein
MAFHYCQEAMEMAAEPPQGAEKKANRPKRRKKKSLTKSLSMRVN